MTNTAATTDNTTPASKGSGTRSCAGYRPLHRIAATGAAFSLMLGIGVFAAGAASAAELPTSVTAEAASESAVLTIDVTGPSTLAVTNPTDKTVEVIVHLEGQHGHGGTTYDAGTRSLPSIGAHADGEIIRFADFSHDWGHNLYGVKYDFLVGGQLVAEVLTPGGKAPAGTTVAQPVPGVVIAPVDKPAEPASAVPEPKHPEPMATPAQVDTTKATETNPTPVPHGDKVPTLNPAEPTRYPVPKLAPEKTVKAPEATPQATPMLVPTKQTTDTTAQAQPYPVPALRQGSTRVETSERTPVIAAARTVGPQTAKGSSSTVTHTTARQTASAGSSTARLAMTGASDAGILAAAAAAMLAAGAGLAAGARRRQRGSVTR